MTSLVQSWGRPTRDQILMGTAYLWAQRSTCSRLSVGCVFSLDGRILVQGYNGAPAGLPHCDHSCNCVQPYPEGHLKSCRSTKPCTVSVHAEQNGISWAAREGVRLHGASMHVTHMPCLPCAMSTINAGISEVVYQEPYRLTDGVDLLTQAGVTVRQAVFDNPPKR